MKTDKKGNILEATEDELYKVWLDVGWEELFSFPTYLQKMQEMGVKIIRNDTHK